MHIKGDEEKRPYRFLDTEADRQALIADIQKVQREVLALAERVPEANRYTPRYHGWSLGAMLEHLNLMDTLRLWLLKLALLGITVPVPRSLLDSFNDGCARFFQRRLAEASMKGIQHKEPQIIDFILTLPLDRFSKTVYDPALEKTITIEQALQEFFLFHWQEHLHTLRLAEDIHSEPPLMV